ncbi:MAG TPA: polyprenyl diphosphate synthase [Dehalococcoidia bacterium]|nr:polyprenyl diphosphate synthase [Dehalococcoidia bacterium]
MRQKTSTIVAERRDKAQAENLDPALPEHVAVIMDGNGRWASQRGLPREEGHSAGTENIRQVIEAFANRGVRYLTLYAFSTENWGRPQSEVDALMHLLDTVIEREVPELNRLGIRVVHIGRLDDLSDDLQRRVREAMDLTSKNDRMTVAIAFNYGGRREIVDAVRRILEDGVPADAVNETLISSYLYTSSLPDPDLIVRTAGEHRFSNFLLWQSAYAEYYVTNVLWPDFDTDEVDCALSAYAQRIRRFGRLHPSELNDAGASAPTGPST